MNITISMQVVKACPYKDETDFGELEIVIPGDAPELHGLAGRISELSAAPVSHEDYTRAVAALVPGAEVTTRWSTGPWKVEVRESAVLRDDVH